MAYTPTWPGPIEGYATNQVHRNLWRVAATHDRDDLMQEARIVFLRCERRYPALDEARHFMALYKTALQRRIHELSNASSRVAHAPPDWEEGRDAREPIGDTDNLGALNVLVRQAPREVRLVLSFFLEAPDGLVEQAERAWALHNRGRQELNAMLNRLLGPAVGPDPVGAVREHFSSQASI